MSTLPPALVVCNSLGLLFVILNSLALGLRIQVGQLLAQFFAQWRIAVWVLVINFVVMPLLLIGYVLTVASSIPP
jgi:bile acid:Na+ symporter, BASS family